MSNKTVSTIQVNWVKLIRNAVALLGFILVMYGVANVTELKFNKLRIGSNGEPVITAAERTAQLDCLSQNIYFEAGHEPFEGKVAVAQVTMNRVASGKFGNGVCGVVNQKNIVYEKVLCQFSWVCDTKSHVKPKNSADYAESEVVAKKVLLESFRLPGMQEAMFYHASYISPEWKRKRITQIGQHIFYE